MQPEQANTTVARPAGEYRGMHFLTRFAVFALVLLWSYWTTLARLVERWAADPQYSHGFFVPLFAAALLWLRRDQVPQLSPSWWGLAILAGAALLRLAAAYIYLEALDAFSLLPALAGACVLLGGWPAWRWAWPGIAFLGFMVPPPYQVETALGAPLRHFATLASTYTLETLGFPAVAEGNVIRFGDVRLGVLDACSGLGMLMTFFALATAVALVVRRPWPDRLALVLSAVPIAVLANVARITASGAAFSVVTGEGARHFLHDLTGWLMMPLALVLLWLELKLLDRLLVPAEATAPLPLHFEGTAPPLRAYSAPRGGIPLPLPMPQTNPLTTPYAADDRPAEVH
jgi:exosortase